MYDSKEGLSMVSDMNIGLSVQIVKILKEYKRNLPIDFLASITQRELTEIRGVLHDLQTRGVVELHDNNASLKGDE